MLMTPVATLFDGDFSKSAVLKFISTSKYPLVFTFTRETGPFIFDHPINKQVMLFVTANESEKYVLAFQQVAKAFKGKLIFVYVERDSEELGHRFGIWHSVDCIHRVVKGKKFLFDGDLTLENVKVLILHPRFISELNIIFTNTMIKFIGVHEKSFAVMVEMNYKKRPEFKKFISSFLYTLESTNGSLDILGFLSVLLRPSCKSDIRVLPNAYSLGIWDTFIPLAMMSSLHQCS